VLVRGLERLVALNGGDARPLAARGDARSKVASWLAAGGAVSLGLAQVGGASPDDWGLTTSKKEAERMARKACRSEGWSIEPPALARDWLAKLPARPVVEPDADEVARRKRLAEKRLARMKAAAAPAPRRSANKSRS